MFETLAQLKSAENQTGSWCGIFWHLTDLGGKFILKLSVKDGQFSKGDVYN